MLADRNNIIDTVKSFLIKDERVTAAWLFGSFARGEENSNSDIDLIIELGQQKKYSMFDLLDISILLEAQTKRKIDLVEKGLLKDFASGTAERDLIRIYG